MKCINLMYHDVYVSEPSESGLASEIYKIDVLEFENQLSKLLELKKLGNNIVVTFDDGGSSFYDPISFLLDKYGFKGLFFISTDYINKPGFLTSSQIIDIKRRGHEIGSHSHSHPDNLAVLSEDVINDEWRKSISILENITDSKITKASIPNGYQSRNVLKSAEKYGITRWRN